MTTPEKRTGPATLQTVERALTFLETVAASAEPLMVKDVSARLGLNITTCYHLFNTLGSRGYIVRQPDLTLRVGPKAALLHEGYRRGFSRQQQMSAFVDALAQTTRETGWIAMLADEAVVLTAYAEGPQAVRATGLYVGLSGTEHRRSSGRAVLAFLDDERRERIVSRALGGLPAAEQARARAELESALVRTRSRGWALDDEEYLTGVVGVAAPFRSRSGEVAGAVGIWAPAARAHQHLEALVDHVLDAARTASPLFGDP